MRIAADVVRGRSHVETLIPKNRNYVRIERVAADGTRTLLLDGYNTRTDVGALWQAGIMGSTSGNPANYIALSTSTGASFAKTDTTLSGEITSGTNAGLSRAQGTYQSYTAPSSFGGSASYQITKTFTSSGTATVNSAALFDAASAGNLFVEASLSPAATLASGDQIILTWTINI